MQVGLCVDPKGKAVLKQTEVMGNGMHGASVREGILTMYDCSLRSSGQVPPPSLSSCFGQQSWGVLDEVSVGCVAGLPCMLRLEWGIGQRASGEAIGDGWVAGPPYVPCCFLIQ